MTNPSHFEVGDTVVLIHYTYDENYSDMKLDKWIKDKGLLHKVRVVYGNPSMNISTLTGSWDVCQDDCIKVDPDDENEIAFYRDYYFAEK